MITGSHKPKMNTSRVSWNSVAGLLLSMTLLNISAGGSALASIAQPSTKSGAVYTREIVRDENGNPFYVEYDASGNEIARGLVLPDVPELDYQVISGDRYRALVSQYYGLVSNYIRSGQESPELLDKTAYQSTNFVTQNGESITKPVLREDTVSVVVAPETARLTTEGKQLLLLELPIDPRISINTSIKSLLIDQADGRIVHQTPNTIGYRVGFFGSGITVSTSGRSYDDKIYGPLQRVPVDLVTFNRRTDTDDMGKYRLEYYMPPCDGYSYDLTSLVSIKLNYKRFNPAGSPTQPYSLFLWDNESCDGSLQVSPVEAFSMANNVVYNAEAVSGNNVSVTKTLDFPVDIMVLTGRASIRSDSGPVAIGKTRFESSRSALARVAQQEYDLDGDGIKDVVRLGAWEELEAGSRIFNINAETPTLQGVWLSSVHGALQTPPENIPPDLTRLPDWSADFDDRALLSEISVDDLGDTDLYVFREADGSLLMERKGLDESERNIGVDAEQGKFAYTLRMVGSRGRLTGGTVGDGDDAEFRQWQMEEGVVRSASALYRREANYLRPGEMVRLIAINRASGYLGSLSVELQSAASGSDDLEMSFNADDIQLLPPNLKVWAERLSRTELGMTKGEFNRYLIGSEGAGMSNDLFIAIHMEWLDVDGTPLPTALAGYGYTARLARIAGENILGAVDNVDSIPVKPGKQMVLLRLPQASSSPGDTYQYFAGNEHFYVQVSGRPKGRADFSRDQLASGSGSAAQPNMLQYRPQRFVPLLAPVFDETTTDMSLQAWNQARQTDSTINKPRPVYQWVYRPEYQFSVYDLQMRELNKQDVAGQTLNILNPEQPVIESTDKSLQLKYSLTGPMLDGNALNPLDAYSYSGNKELVFVLGEEEVSATLSAEGDITIDNLDHLAALDPEDHISLRLYANNDTANVLWEYSMATLEVAVDLNRDGKLSFDRTLFEEENCQELLDTCHVTDKTTDTRPYRFWVNNDLDVVSHMGEIMWGKTNCAGLNPVYDPAIEYEQVCEQWDEDPLGGALSNTMPSRLGRIESYRDLEDFAPLAIRLPGTTLASGYYLELKAENIHINLFKGAWRDEGERKAHSYMQNSNETVMQVALANGYGGHVATLHSGQFKQFNSLALSQLTDGSGVARLIFEGIAPNNAVCKEQPKLCYLSVGIYKLGESTPLLERKIYIDLHDVKDFYQHITAGSAQEGQSGDFDASYGGKDKIKVEGSIKASIYQGVVPQDVLDEHYTMLVHGWRMRDAEKISFAETSFKRLYWSGYMGKFGTVTWPTGWFKLPAHDYFAPKKFGLYLAANLFNYDISELVARRVGADLAAWLAEADQQNILGGSNTQQRHIIAHSMGNIVVSEMLRNSQVKLFDSYASSEAATVAGAYDSTVDEFQHKLFVLTSLDGKCVKDALLKPESAWRCYNPTLNRDSPYDMPPDMYRSDFVERDSEGKVMLDDNQHPVISHGETSDDKMSSPTGTPYYSGLVGKLKQRRMVNFYNGVDAALSAWELNQLTRPNYGKMSYRNDMTDALDRYNSCKVTAIRVDADVLSVCGAPPSPPSSVTSHFYNDAGQEVFWSEETTPGSAAILSLATPTRTKALGQTPKIFSGNNLEFTNSNQDHSAQFHGYYAEPSVKEGHDPVRARYWNWMLNFVVGLEDKEYSRLRNSLGLKSEW